MTTLRFAKPISKPLYGFGGVEVGKIASTLRKRTLNDPATFEITQTAAQHVASGVGSGEPAVDIGNGHEGEPILAMAPGWATRVSDSAGALGVRIDHGAGVTTEYWHLAGWNIPAAGAYVAQGDLLGWLGHTGLGSGAHCHLMLKVNGRAIDPEPFIFGAPLTIEEDGLAVTTTGLKHVINRSTKLTVDSNFRADATRQSAALKVYPGGTAFLPTIEVTGEAIGTNAAWFGGWMYDNGYTFGFFHSSVLGDLVPVEQANCDAAVGEVRQKYEVRIDGIKGELAKAVQRIAGL